jgi:hypothetical protein
MTTLSIANRDMLYSLLWYMSARRTALRAALLYRTPLSITEQTDMRIHYSGYFSNLLAATELFRETATLQPNDFEAQLYSRFVFDGFHDGEANYSYIRELRNAIVHRGLDITSEAHLDGDFLMILAKPFVQNQRRTRTFVAFDKLLLNVIAKCESVIGPVMLDCLNAAGMFDACVDAEVAAAEYREQVEQSHSVPDHAKAMALTMEFKPEWAEAAHSSKMTELHEALVPCSAIKPSLS